MSASTFSFHETYGKHRNPDEIREMERQKQVLQARVYHYGDPVNARDKLQREATHGQKETLQTKLPKNVFAMLRLLFSIFSVFLRYK